MSEEEQQTGQEDAGEARNRDLDAMGLDKRRGVIGGRYGAPLSKQLAVYGGFLAFVAVIVIIGLTVVRGYDQRDIPLDQTAPWADSASLSEPRNVDFPENGPENTIPREQIGKVSTPE